METKSNWIILNLFLPLLPLILRGLIKCLMGHLDFETISGSELWFVMALVSLLIFQDLRLRSIPLDNNDKQNERNSRANRFIMISIICIFFCSANEIFHILVDVDKHEFYFTGNVSINFLSYISAIIVINYSLQTQEEFNLTSKFL